MKRTNVETPEKDVYRFTFAADAQEMEQAVQQVYLRTRADFEVPGYGKSEADRAAIEKENGASVFWYDAINDCMAQNMPTLMEQTIQELGLSPVTDAEYELLHADPEKGFAVTAVLVNEPEMTLGQYTGFEAHCTPNPLGAGDVDHFIQRRRAAMTKRVPQEGPAAKGMLADLDYEGFLDGTAFAGGKAEHQMLELGAGRMIPGFEEGILGHRPGEDFQIHVTFPAEYHAQELAGKAAVFQAHLHALYLRQIPELDDAFAKRAGNVDTMEEYREMVRKELEAMRRDNAMNRARTDIVLQLGQNCTGSLPHALTDDLLEGQLDEFRQRLAMIRKTLAAYLQETGQTEEQLKQQLREAAEQQVRVHLALLQVARKEGLEPTEAEVNAEVEKNAAKEQCTPEEYLTQVSRRAIQRSLCALHAADFVVAHSTIHMDVAK